MYDRVSAFPFAIETIENPRSICYGQYFRDVVHTPGERFGQFVQRYEAKHIAKDADCRWNVVKCYATIEIFASTGPCGKQTVGNGLGE